jgi:NADH dehydrogenase FAD-containing subunit
VVDKAADNRMKALPATAQVAAQQGEYIAHMLNHGADPTAVFHYKHASFSIALVGVVLSANWWRAR